MSHTRVCEWCASEIPDEALKCPECNEWRKDIKNDKIICYSFSGLTGAVIGWNYYSGNWSTLFDSFSMHSFMSTTSGLVTITSFLLSLVYYIKVSKKIGTWFWV